MVVVECFGFLGMSFALYFMVDRCFFGVFIGNGGRNGLK